jgi:hypothetical protein
VTRSRVPPRVLELVRSGGAYLEAAAALRDLAVEVEALGQIDLRAAADLLGNAAFYAPRLDPQVARDEARAVRAERAERAAALRAGRARKGRRP